MHRSISAHKLQVLRFGLGGQKAIESILVVHRQRSDSVGVTGSDGNLEFSETGS